MIRYLQPGSAHEAAPRALGCGAVCCGQFPPFAVVDVGQSALFVLSAQTPPRPNIRLVYLIAILFTRMRMQAGTNTDFAGSTERDQL